MQKTITINIPKDVESKWQFTTSENKVFDITVSIDGREFTYDRNGRTASTKVYVQAVETGVERPSFISTRGTIVINRLIDGTAFDYEATLDFGTFQTIREQAVIGKSLKGTAEAFGSQVAQDFVAQMRRDRKANAERTVYTAAY
jgi:hypothetical protein